jgi:hypothetical protein
MLQLPCCQLTYKVGHEDVLAERRIPVYKFAPLLLEQRMHLQPTLSSKQQQQHKYPQAHCSQCAYELKLQRTAGLWQPALAAA